MRRIAAFPIVTFVTYRQRGINLAAQLHPHCDAMGKEFQAADFEATISFAADVPAPFPAVGKVPRTH